jgi:RsiW-degrading membrane proteinase PrsW (M82 family)
VNSYWIVVVLLLAALAVMLYEHDSRKEKRIWVMVFLFAVGAWTILSVAWMVLDAWLNHGLY